MKIRSVLLSVLILVLTVSIHAQLTQEPPPSAPPPRILDSVGLDQRLNAQVPLDLRFTDEQGKDVALGSYFQSGKPVILSLVYYDCPMLCTQILNGMVQTFRKLPLKIGHDFTAVAVSINPRETPQLAAETKASYMKDFGDPDAASAWHFLVSPNEQMVKRLAAAVGFRYMYDASSDQYAHPSGIMVLTPEGRISRYLYGIDYPPRDLKFSLIDASNNTIGSPVDKILLLCYHYDPMTGKYGVVIMNILRIAFVLIVVSFVVSWILMSRRGKRAKLAASAAEIGHVSRMQ